MTCSGASQMRTCVRTAAAHTTTREAAARAATRVAVIAAALGGSVGCSGMRVGAVEDAAADWQPTLPAADAVPASWRVSATADASVSRHASLRRATGASPTLWIGAAVEDASFVYLTFPLPDAPTSQIAAATLSLRVEDPLVARSIAVEARRVVGAWREDRVTWRRQPTVAREVAGEGTARAGDEVLDIDVTASVAAAHVKGATFVSFLVTPANVDREHIVAFRSRESASSVDALPLAPTLVLAYAPVIAATAGSPAYMTE
mgnify:CR=1 FL=1